VFGVFWCLVFGVFWCFLVFGVWCLVVLRAREERKGNSGIKVPGYRFQKNQSNNARERCFVCREGLACNNLQKDI